jgi:HD-GYP domain-containing protein (c-di-GMP phosphodiesterase class II)
MGGRVLIMPVADTYDAMTSARPYRQPLPREEAKRRITIDSGGQLDPEVVQAFIAIEPDLRAVRETALRVEP